MSDSGQEWDEGRLNDIIRSMLDDAAEDVLQSVEHYQQMAPEMAPAIAEFFQGLTSRAADQGGTDSDRWPASAHLLQESARHDQRFGPYRIIKPIGRGGQGVVYLATDSRLGRRVALKVLSDHAQFSEEALRRFRREAEITAGLEHPGICTVYEAGNDRGRPFIAMRFVDGEPLARRIRGAKHESGGGTALDLRTAELSDSGAPSRECAPPAPPSTWTEISTTLLVLEKAARALHVAHEAGVIHRDIKPGNILVGSDGEPVIVDFGLARRLDPETVPLSLTGDFLGTPHYMSPEQLTPDAGPLDRRTDIYSLGVTLYECLTLHRPFEAPTREGLLQAILNQDPPDCLMFNRSIPADLRLVVQTAMEWDRERRYRTAIDFAEDLRRVRERQPILARPLPRILRLRRWVRRHPGVAFMILGLVLAMAPTLAWFLIPGDVVVTTDPPGARILVNGVHQAEITPAVVSVWPFGSAEIVLRLPGYKDERIQVSPRRFVTEVLGPCKLDSEIGRLVVTTIHRGVSGTIHRDGSDPNEGKMHSLPYPGSLPLPIGNYTLIARGDEFLERRFQFVIRRDQEVQVNVSLSRLFYRAREIQVGSLKDIWTADLDGDGREDFVITMIPVGTGDMRIVRAVSGASFGDLWTRTFGAGTGVIGLTDVDADGCAEVAITTRTSAAAELIVLSGRTGRTIWQRSWIGRSALGSTADLDNDGIPEVLIALYDESEEHGSILAFDLRHGGEINTGEFRWRITSPPKAIDCDGDRRPEICAGTTTRTVVIVDPRTPRDPREAEIADGPCISLEGADIDGDGLVDLLVGTTVQERVPDPAYPDQTLIFPRATLRALTAHGTITIWDDPEAGPAIPVRKIASIVPWSCSGTEGRPRIAMTLEKRIDDDRCENCAETLRFEGDRWGTLAQNTLRSGGPVQAGSADVTGDGIPDLVVTGGNPDKGLRTVNDSWISIRSGSGNGEPFDYPLPETAEVYFRVGDFLGNGRKDIVLLTESAGDGPTPIALKIHSTATVRGDVEIPKEQVMWAAGTGDAIWSSPATGDLDGDRKLDVVIGSHDQYIHALSGIDGTEFWKYKTSGMVWSSPALADLNGDRIPDVIAGSYDRFVHAVSGRDGTPVWPAPFLTNGIVEASPTLKDLDGDGVADVIIGSKKGNLYAISGIGGKEIWRRGAGLTPESLEASPFFARVTIDDLEEDGTPEIIAGNGNGRVYVFHGGADLNSWSYKTDAKILSQAAVGDMNGDGVKDIVIGSYDGVVHVIDGRHRSRMWAVPLSGKIHSSPALTHIDADRIPDIVIGTCDEMVGKIHVLSGRDGSPIWSFLTDSTVNSSPSLRELDDDEIEDIVMCSRDGVVSVLSGRDGMLLDQFTPGGRIYGTPAIEYLDGDGLPEVVIGSYDHNVYALHLRPDLYRRSRADTPLLIQARRHLHQGRHRQALAILEQDLNPELAGSLLRAKALARLGRLFEALAAMEEVESAEFLSPDLGALHLLVTTCTGVPSDLRLVAKCAARDPTTFLETLLGEKQLWVTADAERVREVLGATLRLTVDLKPDAGLLQRVLRLLLGQPSPDLSPEDYIGDPADIDLRLTLRALDRLLRGASPAETEAILARMATEVGKRFAGRWPRTEAELRKELHLPSRQ